MNFPIPAGKTGIVAHAEPRHITRILVVDDDDFFRGREEEVLNRAGYLTMGAADGQEALALLRMDVFDLLLTDWHMPHLDGVGLIRASRAAGIRIPVIMISGSIATGNDLPEDVRGKIVVILPKDADASQILAGMICALPEFLPPSAAAASRVAPDPAVVRVARRSIHRSSAHLRWDTGLMFGGPAAQ